MRKIGLLIICLIITYSIGIIGGIFAESGLKSEWYESVRHGINLPSITFPVVWNILFLLIGFSLWLAFGKAEKGHRKNIVIAYSTNFIFNIFWSIFYFRMHNIGLAFIASIAILLSTIWMMAVAFKIDERATYLLVPYLIWICFATLLNYMSFLKVA